MGQTRQFTKKKNARWQIFVASFSSITSLAQNLIEENRWELKLKLFSYLHCPCSLEWRKIIVSK